MALVDPDIHFESPPVIETVLGVQFDSLKQYRNAHAGVFWSTLGENWDVLEEAPPLAVQFEQFEEGIIWRSMGELNVRLSPIPPIRAKIATSRRDRLIQIQENRFHYNWLAGERKDDYPRYRAVKSGFEEYLSRFRNFLREASIGEISPNQWEITYRNHVPRGDLWDDPSEWGNVLKILPTVVDLTAVRTESIGGEWHTVIGNQLGRLHVKLSHEKSPDNAELLVVLMTARGPIHGSDAFEEMSNGLDIGRNAIVTTFKEITTKEAHEMWRLKS